MHRIGQIFMIGWALYLSNESMLKAQPRDILAICAVSPSEDLQVILISSELDVYHLQSSTQKPLKKNSFWSKFLEKSYIHDYAHKIPLGMRTETQEGYFLSFTKISKKKLSLSVHHAQGLKTAIRSLTCNVP